LIQNHDKVNKDHPPSPDSWSQIMFTKSGEGDRFAPSDNQCLPWVSEHDH
jgi:hypothetical protein